MARSTRQAPAQGAKSRTTRRRKPTLEASSTRYAEAHRLEAVRDAAQAEAEQRGTMVAKAEWLRAEQLCAAAWASALRADGKPAPALKYSEIVVKLAGAHAKAIEQLMHDRVEELHRIAMGRAAAADLLDRREDHEHEETPSGRR